MRSVRISAAFILVRTPRRGDCVTDKTHIERAYERVWGVFVTHSCERSIAACERSFAPLFTRERTRGVRGWGADVTRDSVIDPEPADPEPLPRVPTLVKGDLKNFPTDIIADVGLQRFPLNDYRGGLNSKDGPFALKPEEAQDL